MVIPAIVKERFAPLVATPRAATTPSIPMPVRAYSQVSFRKPLRVWLMI